MSPERIPPEFSAPILRAAVREFAARAGVEVPELIPAAPRRHRMGAELILRRGRPVLAAAPSLVAAPADVQRAVGAHEVAHLALGHLSLPRPLRRLLAAGALIAVLLLLAALLLLRAVADLQPLLATPLFLLAVTLQLLNRRLHAVDSRRREHDADLYAAAVLGAPLTPEIGGWLTGAYGDPPRGRLRSLLNTYPGMRERLARIAAERA